MDFVPVLAGFHIILCIPVLLYRPFNTNQVAETEKEADHKSWCDSRLFRNRSFVIWLFAVFLFQMNYMVPFIHLVRLGEDVGASKTTASFLMSTLSATSFVASIVCGRLADSPCCNRLRICQVTLLCIAVSTSLVAFAPSFVFVALYAGVFGVVDGIYNMISVVITLDIVGEDHFAFALGIVYCTLSIPRSVGPILAGLMFDATQNYVMSFLIIGGLTVVSSMLMFLIRIRSLNRVASDPTPTSQHCEDTKL